MNASCMKENCDRIHSCEEILPFSDRPAAS